MSLWTPYAEAPLDLTKTAKAEQHSPAPENHYYSQVQYMSPIQEMANPGYYPGFYPPMYSVPSAQMSPVSAGSTCSGYDVTLYPRPATLSPPESPQSQKPDYMDTEVLSDDPDFQAFERDALRAMAEKNGGSLLGNNPRMRRAVQSTHAADDTYRRQRERNNYAAKQSRDRRKLREIHLALKVAYLKNEMGKLKNMLAVKTCARCHRQGDC